jgi:hypothetical protein
MVCVLLSLVGLTISFLDLLPVVAELRRPREIIYVLNTQLDHRLNDLKCVDI